MAWWQIFATVLGAITGFGTLAWGIIKYYDQKRDKTIKDLFKETMEPVNVKLDSLTEDHKKRDKQITIMQEAQNSIQEDLNNMRKELDSQKETIFDNEMSRLQTAIMSYAQDLRNNHNITINDYNYVCKMYDRYRKLGGNSFIVSEMEYIKSKFEEFEKGVNR